MPISGRARRGANRDATSTNASLGSSTTINAGPYPAPTSSFRNPRPTRTAPACEPLSWMRLRSPRKKATDVGPALPSDCAFSMTRFASPITSPSNQVARSPTVIDIRGILSGSRSSTEMKRADIRSAPERRFLPEVPKLQQGRFRGPERPIQSSMLVFVFDFAGKRLASDRQADFPFEILLVLDLRFDLRI